MTYLSLLYLIMFFVYLHFGIYVLFLEREKALNKLFFAFCISVSIWSLGYYFLSSATDLDTAQAWFKVSALGWGIFPSIMMHFFLVLTRKAALLGKWWIYLLIYMPAGVFVYNYTSFAYYNIGHLHLVRTDMGWKYFYDYFTVCDWFYNIFLFSVFLFGIGMTWLWFKNTESLRERKQSLLIMITFSVSLILGIVTDIILPAIMLDAFYPLGVILIVMPVCGVWYSIKRYKFMALTPENIARDVLRNMKEGFILLNTSGNIHMVNKMAQQSLGYAEQDLLGKSINHIFEETGKADHFIELTPKGGILEWSKEKYLITKTKEKLPTLFSIAVLQDEWGDTLGITCTFFDITDRKLAEKKLADYTLELEQLYHQLDAEMDKARKVHERILPNSFPAVEGLSFAAHYQPAQILGGDFYDVLQAGNKLIFYLSDVSGHGLDGAMLSVFVKHTIKSYTSYTPMENITPTAILYHLAELFGRENYPDDLYVCVFMAVLDLDSMELSYCSAGLQEALLVQLGNGERQKLHSKGMFITSYLPLDILNLQEDMITLTPGTTIFCNTDGLTEQGIKGIYYRDKLPDVFFQNAHLPAHLVAQAVVDDFRQFNNGSLQGKDDITFLLLQLDPPGPDFQ